MWKGGRTIHSDGYIYLNSPDHPRASNGYVLEHRLVVERHLNDVDPDSPFLEGVHGRKVLKTCFVVHHKNFDKADNRIENLQCMTTSEHKTLHERLKQESAN